MLALVGSATARLARTTTGCGVPTRPLVERERGIFETCDYIFAEGNAVTPCQIRTSYENH
jgi:hypothetical protein